MSRCHRRTAPAWRRHLLRVGVLGLLSASASHVLADLTVDLSTSAADLVAGDAFDLTVTVSNFGPGSVSDVDARVFFLIDDGMNETFGQFMSSSPAGCAVVTPPMAQGYVSCPIASLAESAQTSFTLTLQSSASSTFFLVPGAFLFDNGAFVTGVSDFQQFNVARDTTTDSDGDGVGDLAETLLGFDPDNAFLTPTAPTVDLLIYYGPGAAAEYGGDPTTRINQLVTLANQISSASGAGITYNVRAIRAIADNDTGMNPDSNQQALVKMLNREGVFAGLDAQRNSDAADLVLLMRKFIDGSGNCGFASVLGVGRAGDINFGNASDSALGTVSIDCRDRTAAHEIGHILGLGHDRRDVGSDGTFEYSRGYGVDNNFVTVMGVASNYTNVFAGDEVNLFSSPALDCSALPCGVIRTDPVNGADAAFSLQGVGHLASTFRLLDGDGDTVPDDQDAFPALAGEQFDTDNDGLGNNADLDDDGDGMADAAEVGAGLNPFDPADALLDPDGDGYNNRDEIAFGTAINDAGDAPVIGGSVLRIVVGALQP